jgi:hypothetical protein
MNFISDVLDCMYEQERSSECVDTDSN